MERAKWSKWGLLVVLLGMMVAMSGCFGGGGPVPTGGVGGIVCVPKGDDASPIHLLQKGLETIPAGYQALGNATIKIAGETIRTNSQGYFELWDIPQGRRLIEITHGRYQPYSAYVTIYADKLAWVSPVKLGVGYYLLVGVGDFEFEGAASLGDGPLRDVSAMELALAKDDLWIGDYEVLIDEEATYDNFQYSLQSLMSKMNENDFLVIYFSGHGVGGPSSFLESDAIVLHNDFVIDVELEEWIRNGGLDPRTNSVTLILDACYSGSFADGVTRYPDEFQMKAFRSPGYTVLASSNNINESTQAPLGQHGEYYGVFTYHLVSGFLSGEADYNKDGTFTAYELSRYVDEHARSAGLTQRVHLYPSDGSARIFQYR